MVLRENEIPFEYLTKKLLAWTQWSILWAHG